MKRILYDVPRWSLYLHREARGLPTAEPSDNGMTQLADELFERLYSGADERLPEKLQDPDLKEWAGGVHDTCDQQPNFQRLCADVRGDAYAAGVAVEKLLEELNPHLPQVPQAPALPGPLLRRLVGKGSQAASAAVDEAREAQEGLGAISWGTGTSVANTQTPAAARVLASRLKSDHRLRRIAMLAGRFKRIAAAKQRSKVRHGTDEITDVEQGADLGRLLPSELGRLMHPLQRLSFLRDFSERRCLQYQLTGTDTLGRGPLVVCLDKSGSMENDRDVWATAVALALLEVTQRERRTFGLLAFDGAVKFEAVVKPSEPLPHEALFVGCSGGTSIATVVQRGLEIVVSNQSRMKEADIVLITDGGSDAEPAPALREQAKQLGVTVLGVGIGVAPELLAPWCDDVSVISDLMSVSEEVADLLFAH